MQETLPTPAPAHEGHAVAPAPRWTALTAGCAALQFLTILPPLVRRPFTARELGQAVGYFPLVGLALGAILVGTERAALSLWPAGVATVVVLTAWVVLTGAMHLDGFLDTCDGLLGGRTPEERMRILRDERVGAYAVAGSVLLLLGKFQALAAIGDRTEAVLVAPTLARAAMAWAIVFFPYARPQGLGRDMKDAAGWRQAALAATMVVVVAGALASKPALIALALAPLITLGVARFTLRRLPGLTGDVYGTIGELVELAILLTFAAGGGA